MTNLHIDSIAYREDFVCWASNSGDDYPYGDDHPGDVDCDWGWVCNQDGCYNRADTDPCSDHAPVAVPGLRLVECQASPRHWLFAHDRDDYGHSCPWCEADRLWATLSTVSFCTHRPWWRWRVTGRTVSLLYRLRMVRSYHWSHGDGCHGCLTITHWRWSK